MDEAFIQYLKDRMRRLGITDFDYELVSFTVNNSTTYRSAINEYWYLLDVSNTDDNFIIKASNVILQAADMVIDGIPSNYIELTGNIMINTQVGSPTTPHIFTFCRAIPD